MEIVLRATVIYFFLWVLTRAIGKRELAGMSSFELVLLVSLGDLIQQGVTQEDMSLTGAMLAVGTIATWVLLFSYVSWRFPAARRVVEGVPVVVVDRGRVIDEALRTERLPVDELLQAARLDGIADLRDVRLGVLEPDGRFSFITEDGGGSGGGHDEPAALSS